MSRIFSFFFFFLGSFFLTRFSPAILLLIIIIIDRKDGLLFIGRFQIIYFDNYYLFLFRVSSLFQDGISIISKVLLKRIARKNRETRDDLFIKFFIARFSCYKLQQFLRASHECKSILHPIIDENLHLSLIISLIIPLFILSQSFPRLHQSTLSFLFIQI